MALKDGWVRGTDYIRWNLIEARLDLGLKQSELASMVGTTQKSISNWEKGIHTPRTAQAIKLVDVLGKDITHLLSAKKER